MKQKFSTKWIGSKQPRKQRKYRTNAPLHIKHGLISGHLNKDLRKKYGRRSFPLRKGDKVKIMVGEFKNRTGKISLIDKMKLRVAIEGMQKTKKEGSKVNVYFNPSNLLIQELFLEDKKRIAALERNKKSEEKETEKPKYKKLPKTEKPKQGEKQDGTPEKK
jgi:large subunit ribosomal protein L24